MQYGVLWPLALEEHFYLLWPAAVRAQSRHGSCNCRHNHLCSLPKPASLLFHSEL
jgi:peptidoglycan/LPS O-acetylase OafA/YrhL